MATLLKGTVMTRCVFMVIEMALPRGFSYFILGAEKDAKNCTKMVIFVHSDACDLVAEGRRFGQKVRPPKPKPKVQKLRPSAEDRSLRYTPGYKWSIALNIPLVMR